MIKSWIKFELPGFSVHTNGWEMKVLIEVHSNKWIVADSLFFNFCLPAMSKKGRKKERKILNPLILLGYILQIRICDPTRSPHSLTAGCDDTWYDQVTAKTTTSTLVITPWASIFLWHTFISLHLSWFWNIHSHDTLIFHSKYLIIMDSVMKEGNMSSCLEKTARNTLMLKTFPVWRIVNRAEINVSKTVFGMMFFCSYVALG